MNNNEKGRLQHYDGWLLVDRLAADELEDDSRRELFAWLDREPARWRRCAMALLEAREWQNAMDDCVDGSLASWPAARTNHRPVAGATDGANAPMFHKNQARGQEIARFSRPHLRRNLLAMAASVAIAFVLGAAAGRQWFPAPSAGNRQSPVAIESQGPSHAMQAATRHRTANPSGDNKDFGPERDGVEADAKDDRMPSVDSVAQAFSGSDDSRGISAYVRSQLERRGYRIDSRREFVSVALPDGRRVSAPVEKWMFRFVGNRVY